jgi:hypothetical protein
MQKEGLPSSTQAISFSSYPRHPICDVLSSIQKQMTEAISKIVLFEQSPYSDWNDTPELLDVEYLPLPTKSLYFKPKRGNPLSRKKHSQFVLTALYAPINEQKQSPNKGSTSVEESGLFLFDDGDDNLDIF